MQTLSADRAPKIFRTVASALAVGLVFMWAWQITPRPTNPDSLAWLKMAVNLDRHGVLSVDTQPPYTPTNYREPVPSIVSAAAIHIVDGFAGEAEAAAYTRGPRAQYVKYQNLLWLALISLGAFWTVRSLTSSRWLGLLGVALINFPLRPQARPGPVDDLYTEIPSTGLLILAALLLARAFTQRSLLLFALSGLLFGVLALTKAVMLYVFVGVVGGVVLLQWLQQPRVPWSAAAREFAVLVVAFAAVVAPWLYRNHVQLDTWQLTQRDGESLYERALMDRMSSVEYAGSFYAWAPFAQNAVGALLGFSAADLQAGGRLQRFESNPKSALSAGELAAEKAGRPDLTVTFYRRARAERERIRDELIAAGHAHPDIEGEAILKAEALRVFRDDPWGHLALTLPLLWRGAADSMPILLVALLFGLRQRRFDLVLFALPAFGMVAAYALFTPYVPRYGVPSRLIAILVLLLLMKLGWDALRKRQVA